MKPKEALALMGAHTIGRYSGFQTHIDYAWVSIIFRDGNYLKAHFDTTCSTEFEQIARQLEFELQPRIFILLPRYYV